MGPEVVVLGLLVTAVFQLVVVVLSGSVALLADTIHNFAHASTAIPLGIAFLLGRRGATRRFSYGLGRVEDLAGLLVILTITASALVAAYEAIHRLVHLQPVEMPPSSPMAITLVSTGGRAWPFWLARSGYGPAIRWPIRSWAF